ncbi:MAG: host attachment protein [Gammaproteobacteria bacterium]|nr:host attachment protein [Gammaproteobacteria bacterium]MDH5652722.1 host attachment protein [Gammaproteobacteria bacterium]
MTDKLWVVVADSARARILSAENRTAPLVEIKSLEHPEGRMHAVDLTSDLPGRDSDRSGMGRHAVGTTDPKQYEAENFAREITTFLEDARNQNRFFQLVIIAAPSFLGILRNLMSTPLARLVASELDKNLTQLDVTVIRENLSGLLSPEPA